MEVKILKRERDAILAALKAGVVPRAGIHHIQVGRKREIDAMLNDLGNVEEGSSSVRFVVGSFGSGKSFFLKVIQTVAMKRNMVVLRADITTDRRLQATGGQARALYGELMANLSTKSKPDGAALRSMIERWIDEVDRQVKSAGGDDAAVECRIDQLCAPLRDLVGGHDFVTVLRRYHRAHHAGDEQIQTDALRWLRGEFPTRTEARAALDVRSIIDDDSWYDHLKLFARFCRIAGHAGLLVCLDELVVLSHRLNNSTARSNNYEAILRILNDCLQGEVEHLGLIFAATDQCLTDTRRGLFSYEALATRLAPNRFAREGLIDVEGPVLNLAALTEVELRVLLENIRRVENLGDADPAFPDEAIDVFMGDCQRRLGARYFQTPREVVKDFVGLLHVLRQNPGADWHGLIADLKTDRAEALDPSEAAAKTAPDDDLATFRL